MYKIDYRKADGRKEAYCLVKRYLTFTILDDLHLAYHLDSLDRKRQLCLRCQDFAVDFAFGEDAVQLEVAQHGLGMEVEKKVIQEMMMNIAELI